MAVPANGRYFTFDELVLQVSEIAILRAMDDDHDGVIDAAVVERFVANADIEVDSYAEKGFPDHVGPGVTPETAHPRLKALALELCGALIMHRYPSLFPECDTLANLKMARKQLSDLSLTKTHLQGVQAENTRGTMVGIAPDRIPRRHWSNWGEY